MPDAASRGRFVWHELLTPDAEAATAFYTRVVGWDAEERTGPYGPYTVLNAGGRPVAGVARMRASAIEAGVPPFWAPYLATPMLDANVARAEDHGASAVAATSEIPGIGRFVLLSDPQGSAVGMFEIGADGADPAGTDADDAGDGEPRPGDFSWHELHATDHAGALRFYADVFGWREMAAVDMGPDGAYRYFGAGGRVMGAVYDGFGNGAPYASWLSYIRVDDIGEACDRITEAGGQVVAGPEQVSGGEALVAARDPQGVLFGLHQIAPVMSHNVSRERALR